MSCLVPHRMESSPVVQGFSQVRRAMPGNGKLLGENIIVLFIGQTMNWCLATGCCHYVVPLPLDFLEEGLAGCYGRWRKTGCQCASSFLDLTLR